MNKKEIDSTDESSLITILLTLVISFETEFVEINLIKCSFRQPSKILYYLHFLFKFYQHSDFGSSGFISGFFKFFMYMERLVSAHKRQQY